MNKRSESKVRRRLACACASGVFLYASTLVCAQTATPPTPAEPEGEAEMETLYITGSRLSGAAAEGTLSVSTYRMDVVTAEGYSDVGDLVRKRLPQFGGGIGTVNDSFGNGGSGAATVSLRNLPGSRTLVLLNGRRTQADLNLIPTTAIERVEVLNDGASAIYGSDAVAGVMNIILKKDFQGIEFGGRYANTTETDISERRFNVVVGGSNSWARATLGLEYSKSNEQFSIDREISTPTGDMVSGTSNPGLFSPRLVSGVDWDPVTQDVIALRWRMNPAVSTGLTPTTVIPAAFNPQAFLTFPKGTTSSAQRTAARDAEETRLNGVMGASSPVVYGPNYTYFAGLNPGFPYGYYTFAVRPHERKKMFFNLEADLSDNIKAFADVFVSQNQSINWLAPSPLSGTTVPTSNYWFTQVFDNQAGQTRTYSYGYRPTELGPRETTNDFSHRRMVLGLRGELAGNWEWEVAFMNDVNKLYQVQAGGVLASVYTAALAGTTSTTAFNPFGFTPLYGSTNPVNTAAMIDSFKGSADATYYYHTKSWDASITGQAFDLPAGPVKVAGGLELRTEKDIREPSDDLVAGAVFPFNGEPAFSDQRKVNSVYAEAEIPVFPTFKVTAAARVEDYDDAGSTGLKPRISFKWEPISKVLAFRGSFAQGFVAPSMYDLKPGDQGQDFTEILNPVTGTRTQPEEGVLLVGNPDLQPAESDSYLVGVVYSPEQVKGLSVGLNYYRIEETGIPFASAQYIVTRWAEEGGDDNASNPFGPAATPSAANPTGAQVETASGSGELYQVRNVGAINTGDRNTDGIDIFASYVENTEMGTFTWEMSWTKVLTFEQEDFPGAGLIDYLGRYWGSGAALDNYGFPKWKGSTSLSWKKNDWVASLAYNYVDGYMEVENDDNKVSSYSTFDVRVGTKLPWIGSSLLAGVNNAFDKQPPFVVTSFENGHDRAIADIRGRMFFVELKHKF